jgi:hypothetical protein
MLVYGFSCVVALVVGAAFFLGLVDYGLYHLFRLDDVGVRVICSATLVIAVGLGAYYFLFPALFYRRSDEQVAQRIERRFPQLRDRLSSTLAFLIQAEDDPTAGSPALRRAVVAETAAAVEGLDFASAIDARRPWLLAGAALLVCATVTGVCVLDVQSSQLAARRLLMPLGNDAWPRLNSLHFENPPRRLAAGGTFEAVVIDQRGRLPDDVKFVFGFDGDGGDQIQTKEMKPLGDKMVYRLENVTRPLRYRAIGGDDTTMTWQTLDVVEPPRITSLQIKLHPPPYTGLPVEESSKDIRALEGTRIEVTAETGKPLSAVSLKIEGDDAAAAVSARLINDGTGFLLPGDPAKPWVAGKSGSYWFELTDREQLKGGADMRGELRVVTDQPPTVSLDKPDTNTHVTASAVVPLVALIKDDLAVASIELRYIDPRQSDRGEQVISLFRGPAMMPRKENRGLVGSGESGESRTVEYRWDLSQLAGLQPGAVIDFHVLATDYKPQSGQSTSRRLTIISPDDLQDRMVQRQSYILGQLAEALRVERESRSQTKSLEIQLQEAGQFAKQDIDHLQSAELNQRQVQRLLSDPGEGVQTLIVSLLADLDNNRLDSPDVKRHMSELLAEVRRIDADHLPVIQREMIAALKVARAELVRDDDTATPADKLPPVNPGAKAAGSRSLGEAGQHQDEVISALERLLGELSQWDNYRRFAREISRIRGEQEELQQQTNSRLADPLLTKDIKDFTPQQLAELKRLAQRQSELALRFDKMQSRMRQMQLQLQESDPLAAATIADALDAAQRLAIGGQMRESGRSLESNRIGQSSQLQQETIGGLEELLDVLANRREHELGRLVKQLREAADELNQLRQRQKELTKQIEQAANNPDAEARKRELERLTKEQQEAAAQANQLARRLMRLQAERAGSSTSRAGAHSDKAAEASQQGDAARALDEAQQAERRLEDAQRELQEELQQVEQDLLHEQLARLEQDIVGMLGRQQRIVDETIRLDGLRLAQGRFERSQLKSVFDLAAEQQTLASEAGVFAEKVAQAEAFALGLRGIIRQMQRAAMLLDARETGAETKQAEQQAFARLQQLLEALRPDSQAGDDGGGGGQGGGNQQQGPPADVIRALAELKLLKLMQEEIMRRTAELEDAQRRGGGLTDEQQTELAALAQEQGRLADLIFNLAPPPAPNPEDNPDQLPDVRQPKNLDDELDKALRDALPSLELKVGQ